MKQNKKKEKQNSLETPTEPAATTRRQRTDEFCKRLGIRIVNEKGGMEFVPYRGSQESSEICFSDEQDEFDALPEEFKEHLWKGEDDPGEKQ